MEGFISEAGQAYTAKVSYDELMESWLYQCTITRLNITLSVIFSSRYMKTWLQMHLFFVKRILMSLVGTVGYAILVEYLIKIPEHMSSTDSTLSAFSDSDRARDI